MKKLMYLIFLLGISSVFGQNEALFEEANLAYSEEDYETAVQKYKEIIENGEASASVYYNLGNTHYRLNNIAPSVYYYEKALQLAPNDPDVLNNIRFARNMTIDDIEEVEQTGLEKRIRELISTFSYNTWAKMSIGFSVLFVALFLGYYFAYRSRSKRLLFTGAAFTLFLGIASIIFAFEQQNIRENNKFAVIFSEAAEVRSEPNLRGQSAFTLHEGTKAKVLENFQDWVKIEIADGKQGWIEMENLRKL